MSEDGPSNRLAGESSPYLLLHRSNPVDWYPWGEEAIRRAREEDRPIFLSVGYSTCYWCHVMERESFSDPEMAERMNRDFVNVKVDREERPDLDEIYMAATQILTGHGGWPNSVFLTPDLEPFYAGTYFPPLDRQGLPGFATVLRSMSQAWRTRRADVEAQAESVSKAIRHYLEERDSGRGMPPADVAERSLADLEHRFDPRDGGFGGAPKFPTPSNLLLLLELAGERPRAAEMLDTTLDRMARGGLFDQLGGGFHRYATDGEWKVPHFEKMLYDNGYLLEIYARRFAATGDPDAERVVRLTAGYLGREMTSPRGALWSAQDAETEGREGAFYVWSRSELLEALGDEDFGFLAPLYGFDGPPFFEGDRYVLHLPAPLAEAAGRRRLERHRLEAEIEPLREKLLAVRAKRPPLAIDDKVLADWNGIAIAGLATAGRALGDAALVERAAAAAEFALSTLRGTGGVLLHAWRDGRGGVEAFLSDYVELGRGLLALHRASGDERWLERAVELAGEQAERLGDPEAGGFFLAAERDDLLFRSKEVFDGATPSANGVAVLNLLELEARTGEGRWLEAARRALEGFGPLVDRQPQAARTLALAARRFHQRAGGGLATAVPAAAGGEAETPPVRGSLELGPADGEGWRAARARLEVADGWHLAAGPPPAGLQVRGEGIEIDRLELPAPVRRPAAPGREPIELYRGALEIGCRVRPAPGGALAVRYQACDERRCQAPAELRLPVDRS